MSFRVIERESGVKPETPAHVCMRCVKWMYFIIRQSGWWYPQCGCWNKEKSTKEILYGPNADCPMSLEHMVLAKRHKFKFDSITDCEPVLELYKRGELESIFMGSNLLLRRKDENTVYKTNVDKFIVNLSRLLEGSWKDIDN